MTTKKTVCVIGAGASGIVTMKQLLDEGHSPTCFEKSHDLGGVFNYSKGDSEQAEGATGVYKNTVLTISNYLMCFSDMPPEGPRRHWHHTEYLEYLAKYVEKFNLRPHIRLGVQVHRVRPRKQGAEGYEVTVIDGSGRETTQHFDALAVCTGTHQVAKVPKLPGLDDFGGQVMHSSAYDSPELARGKNVLCVGLGESSADITREISDVAANCHLGLRSYPFLIPRNLDHSSSDSWTSRLHHDYYTPKNESTLSYLALALYYAILGKKLFALKVPERDSFLQDCQAQMLDLDTPGDADCIKLIKAWNYLSKGRKFATKNVTFVPNVINGKIQVNASGIERLTKSEVVFNDGEVRPIDLILFCTGYQEDFSFIEGFKLKDGTVRSLFMNSVPTDLENCVFVGWARPVTGGIPACSEMAARYFAQLLSGNASLPPDVDRRIEEDRRFYHEFYAKHSPEIHTVVAWKRHLEKFSELVGCQVHPLKYLNHPELFVRLFAGSLVPYQYRLEGPHARPEEAKAAILALDMTLPHEHIRYGLRMNLRNKVPGLSEKTLRKKADLEYSQLFSEWFRMDVPLDVGDVKRFSFRRDDFVTSLDELDSWELS